MAGLESRHVSGPKMHGTGAAAQNMNAGQSDAVFAQV